MNSAVERFTYGTGLSHWSCYVLEVNKWVYVQHSDIVSHFLVMAIFYCANTLQLHYICLTGNFRKGVFRVNWITKWVAAWKRLKSTDLEPKIRTADENLFVSVCTTNVRSYVCLYISRNHLLQQCLILNLLLEIVMENAFFTCLFLESIKY